MTTELFLNSLTYPMWNFVIKIGFIWRKIQIINLLVISIVLQMNPILMTKFHIRSGIELKNSSVVINNNQNNQSILILILL